MFDVVSLKGILSNILGNVNVEIDKAGRLERLRTFFKVGTILGETRRLEPGINGTVPSWCYFQFPARRSTLRVLSSGPLFGRDLNCLAIFSSAE